MSKDDKVYITDFISIPKELYSFETGKLFSHCIDCEKYLLKDGQNYIIQKSYKGEEVILEFAYCLECHDNLADSYSKKTMTNVWNFFLDNVKYEKRRKKLLAKKDLILPVWTSSCLTCKTPRDKVKSYTIIAECDGSDLLFYYLPWLICEECEMRIYELMSEESRDIWDKWIGDNFDVPPSLPKTLQDGKFVMI